MSRLGWVLIALLSVLLIIGWYFLIFDPTSEDIEDVRAETDLVLTQASEQRARAAQLREIRENAPEAESSLSAGRMLIPEEPSIPALFRQMQQAADDAGVRLTTITPSEPSVVAVGEQQVTSIGVSLSLTGTYFQVVDLSRRIEDPTLTPRALRWDAASLSPSEFPELTVSLSGQIYSRGLTQLPTSEEPAEEQETETDQVENGVDGDEPADEDLDEVTP